MYANGYTNVDEYAATNSFNDFGRSILNGVAIVGISVTSAFATPQINVNITQDTTVCETISNNNNIDYSGSIEKISELSTISTTIESFSPYAIKSINFSTSGEEDELINIVDVYTEETNKDDNLLFEAEGLVLGSLPDNYFIRYF